MDDDIHADLKAATHEELLLSLALLYEEAGRIDIATGLRIAVKVVQPDGWQQVAPAWLRRWREQVAMKREIPEGEGEENGEEKT